MHITRRREELLAKAKRADERAEKAKDPEVKAIWREIAEGYRTMAHTN